MHDIYITPNSYKLEFLGELSFNKKIFFSLFPLPIHHGINEQEHTVWMRIE